MTARPAAEGIPSEHLAALSHELRTPLGGVLGMAQLLATTPLSAEQRAYVDALKESGEHLLGLVNDVLDYARLGGAHAALDPREVDVEDLLRGVAELMSPRCRGKGIEIGWAVAGAPRRILADEGRLRQILLNFAGNAVKFVAEGGVLLSAEERPGDRIRFRVDDTGPGVPQADRARIFEAFTRLAPGTAGEAAGAGLGLAIAQRIAEAMGGTIGVEDFADGGASFWFEAALPTVAPPGAGEPGLDGRAVVVASPSAIVRECARAQIEASGGRVRVALDLAAAIANAHGHAVILADHAEAGEGLLDPPTGRAAVVMLAPEERGLIEPYRRAGFAGYLIKPLRRASVISRVLLAAGVEPPSLPDDERVESFAEPSPAAGSLVLLAEDNPVNAMLARTLLARQGCEVDHVADGAAAFEAATARAYDLILMDVRMPGVDGIEATRRLRQAGVGAPVLALTADAFDGDRAACLRAGMDDFLVKPLSAETLRPVLARWGRGGSTAAPTQAKIA